MFVRGLTQSWEVDKKNKKKEGVTMFKKKIKNFLLKPSRSKMDHKKAINENVSF